MNLFELTAKIVLEYQDFVNGLKEGIRSADELKAATESASDGIDAIEAAASDAASSIEDLADVLVDGGETASEEAQAVRESSSAKRENASSSKEAATAEGDFASEMQSAINSIKAFAKASLVVGGAVKIGKYFADTTIEVANFGDQIDKQSQKLGISAQAYQEWGFILQHTGSDIGSLTTAMRTMTAQAADNSDAFAQLGVSTEDLSRMSQEDIFAKTIAGLQNVENSTQRAQLASQIFGRSYMELNPLLNMTNAETSSLAANFQNLGGAMSDAQVKNSAAFKDALTDFEAASQGFKNMVANVFTPAATAALNLATKTVSTFTKDTATGNTVEEAEAALEALKKERQIFIETYGNAEDAAFSFDNMIANQVRRIEDLREAEAKAAEKSTEEAAEQIIASKAAELQAAKDNLAALQESYEATYGNILKNVEGYFDAFERATQGQSQSVDEMISNMESQVDWNNQYAASMDTISQYAQQNGLDITQLSAAFAEAGTAGADYANAVAQAIEAGDAEKVGKLVDMFGELNSSQEGLAEMLTGSITNFDNLSEQAKADISAVEEEWARLQKMDPVELVINVTTNGTIPSGVNLQPGHSAGGIDYVPSNNYLRLLHEGERVMTKEDNKRYMSGKDSNSPGRTINIYQTIQSIPQTPADLAAATQAYFEQAMWGI